MFEAKISEPQSEFSQFLDTKRKCIAISDLTDEQYLVFRKEVLNTLNTIKLAVDEIIEALNLKYSKPYFNADILKLEIYTIYSQYNNNSYYFKRIIDSLITAIDDCSFEQNGAARYDTNKFKEKVKNIAKNIEATKDKFFIYSIYKESVLSIASSENHKNKENSSLENKYLLYRNLINLTSNFSLSFESLRIPESPDFLARFFNYYDYKREKADVQSPSIEEKAISRLKKLVSGSNEVLNYLNQTNNTLSKLQGELRNYDTFKRRLFYSREVTDLYQRIKAVIVSYLKMDFKNCDWITKKFQQVFKKCHYNRIKELTYDVSDSILSNIYHCSNELKNSIQANFEVVSKNISSLNFIREEDKTKLIYLSEDELKKVITEARLLNLFYCCYHQLPNVSLTDEELIKLINNNAENVLKLVKSLIECIEEYLKTEEALEDEYYSIKEYLDYMKTGRKLTEVEVVDEVIKKCLNSNN